MLIKCFSVAYRATATVNTNMKQMLTNMSSFYAGDIYWLLVVNTGKYCIKFWQILIEILANTGRLILLP